MRGFPLPGELAGLTALIAKFLGPVDARGGGVVRLGVPEAFKAPLVAALASRAAGPLLLVTGTPARAQAMAEEALLHVSGIPVVRLPEQERLPYEFTRDEPGFRYERAQALGRLRSGEPALVIASWAAMAEYTAAPAPEDAAIDIRTGDVLDPVVLAAQLVERGYEVADYADRPATLVRHGGLVDVFPVGADNPFRVEFFGNEVDSIRGVDPGSQRSTGRVESLHLPPAAVATEQGRAGARRLLEQIEATGEEAEVVAEQLELLAGGQRTEYEAFFEPLISRATALDHFAANVELVLDDPEEGERSLASACTHDDRARGELEERGALPRGLPPLHLPAPEFRDALFAHASRIELQRFGSEELGARRLDVSVTPGFAGKLRPLVQQAGAWAGQGRAVVIASQQALRLADLMEEEGIQARLTRTLTDEPNAGEVTLVPLALSGGYMVGESAVVVTDAEVFGFRKRRRPTRARHGVRPDLVATLEPGDYLVHADHGIARYGGLVRRTVDDVEREYIELQYAEGDRLYVPADQLELVSRYVGPADHPPSLTKLGSQEWTRTKRRVRQAVAELAHELLELYAQRELAQGFAFPEDNAWQMEMEAAFPFVETPDQAEAIAEVKSDMHRVRPMDRLICGDVGYGKTEVAIRAAFKAVTNGKQVAVLVPTTVLAEQHGHTFRERVAGFPVRVEVLSRFRNEQQQREIVSAINSGEVDIAIGTHRLLGKDVNFRDLGLVIVDEEQRFGVSHKERLKQMRAEVDVLTLSATPIPRTLQMSLAGIRDMSTVMTPPEERLPIRTYVTEWDNGIIREAIERELQRGGQVFFVHNRVHNIERIVARLREIVPEAEFLVGHGQMPEEQLERVMMEFAAGDADVLVCTTIIESGLDIPNANTIIINDANQLGLAQLYQLRGRVGRGANRAYAYLLYDKSRALTETAQKRLEAIFEASELGAGFQIALRDLEIRGAGNILGSEQSGHIASVGFEMYSKLLADAVGALKAAARPGEPAPPRQLAPVPSIDVPLSAHIPENYIPEVHLRLAAYQRIADISSVEAVADMQAELADRFGHVPPAVEHLLFVALVKSLARRARVEAIKTDAHMLHVHVRGGLSGEQRRRMEALNLGGVVTGPNQVRIDRATAGEGWMQMLIRVLRALSVAEGW